MTFLKHSTNMQETKGSRHWQKRWQQSLEQVIKSRRSLPKLAQYELTLKDWVEEHKGYRKFVAIAGKCWPAFQTQFGFVPCYVNSRLDSTGYPGILRG